VSIDMVKNIFKVLPHTINNTDESYFKAVNIPFQTKFYLSSYECIIQNVIITAFSCHYNSTINNCWSLIFLINLNIQFIQNQ